MVRDPEPRPTRPFDGGQEPSAYHVAAAHEEALARLEWLLEERQRCGLVVADSGFGKTHLAAVAARRLGGMGAEVAVLSLGGLPEGEWIELLLERLPLDAASRAESLRPWVKLENRLRENALMERPTVLFFDDADRAPDDALDGIGRIVSAGEPRFASTVVVATTTPHGLGRLPDAIRRRAAIRVELPAWAPDDVAAYLAAGLRRAGCDPERFSPAAAETIGRFAAGVPATVRRIAQLACAAADGEGLERIDAATVERVWRELLPSEPAAGGRQAAGDEADTCGSTVRVVRRLGG